MAEPFTHQGQANRNNGDMEIKGGSKAAEIPEDDG